MSTLITKVVFFDIGMTLIDSDKKQWNTGAQAVLTQLHDEGVRLGVISNTGKLKRAELQSRLPPDFDWKIFEPNLVLLSSEVGIEKPSLDIFRLAIERARVAATQCLYCSEDMLETLAAQRAGMIAARIHPPPDSDLKTLVEMLRSLSKLH